ncbi:hypothetical protein Q9R34_12945, partial [Enterobacter sp. BRE11]|nr:hypothetical protein [Enterobacter sp. BRE11]
PERWFFLRQKVRKFTMFLAVVADFIHYIQTDKLWHASCNKAVEFTRGVKTWKFCLCWAFS